MFNDTHDNDIISIALFLYPDFGLALPVTLERTGSSGSTFQLPSSALVNGDSKRMYRNFRRI